MKATINAIAHSLTKYAMPKKGIQAPDYHLVDQDGNRLLARITKSGNWPTYTYVEYSGSTYYFPKGVEIPSGTKVEFSEGAAPRITSKTVPTMDAKPIDVEGLVQAHKIQEASESVEEYYQAQMEPTPDPLEAAEKWVQEQETKRGLGQAPTIAEYLPQVKSKNKPPRRAAAK